MSKAGVWALGAAVCAGAAMVSPQRAWAGAFALWEGSPDQMASAYAGQGAKAYDAGTAWTNPAGMVRIGGDEIDAGFNYIDPQFYFSGGNSDFPNPGAVGASYSHVSGIDPAVVPSSFSVMSLTPDLKFGLAIKSPFGARIDYPDNWVGRYQSVVSSLTDISIEPSLAYAVTPKFSIGGGPVIDYINIRETQAVRPAIGASYGDIDADVYGENWAFGYNLAAMYQLDDDTRFGISYRSRIEHRIDIQQTLTESQGLALSPLASLINGVLATQNTPGHPYAQGVEKFNLPDSVDGSFYWQLTPEWSLMAEAVWTHWQIFNNITITTFDTGNAPISNLFNFHNTMFGSVGAGYRPHWMPKLLVQTGAGYDEDPVSDSDRQAQIPTQDRVLVGFGATYDVSRNVSLALAYSHYFGLGSTIDATGPSLANALQLSEGRLIGSYNNDIDSFSAGIKVRF
jgi:long-chain fatty acid transport protein